MRSCIKVKQIVVGLIEVSLIECIDVTLGYGKCLVYWYRYVEEN